MYIQKIIFYMLVCVSCFVRAGEHDQNYQLLDDAPVGPVDLENALIPVLSSSRSDREPESIPFPDDAGNRIDRPMVVIVAPPGIIQERGCALGKVCSWLMGEGILGFIIGASLPEIHFDARHDLGFGKYVGGDDAMALSLTPMVAFLIYFLTGAFLTARCCPHRVTNAHAASAIVGITSGLTALASQKIVGDFMDCPLTRNDNMSLPLLEHCASQKDYTIYTAFGSMIAVMGSVTVIMCNFTALPQERRCSTIKSILARVALAAGIGMFANLACTHFMGL